MSFLRDKIHNISYYQRKTVAFILEKVYTVMCRVVLKHHNANEKTSLYQTNKSAKFFFRIANETNSIAYIKL